MLSLSFQGTLKPSGFLLHKDKGWEGEAIKRKASIKNKYLNIGFHSNV